MKVTVLSLARRDSGFDDESSEDAARGEWCTAKAAALVVARPRRFEEQDDNDDGTRAKIIAANAIVMKQILVDNNMVRSMGTRFYLHCLSTSSRCCWCGCSSGVAMAKKNENNTKGEKRTRSKMGVQFGWETKLPVTGLRHCTVCSTFSPKTAGVNAKNSCCPPMKPVETSAVLQEVPTSLLEPLFYKTKTHVAFAVHCRGVAQRNDRVACCV